MADQTPDYLELPRVREAIDNVAASHNRLPVDHVLAVLHETIRSVSPDREEVVPTDEVRRIAEAISDGTWGS